MIDTGLPLDWLDTSPGEIIESGEAIAAIAKQQRADIVQTSSAGLLCRANFTQPTIAVQHSSVACWWAAVKSGPLPSDFQWRRDLVEVGLKRACAVVAPSIAFAAETARIYGVEVVAVYNGRASVPSPSIPQGHFVFTAGRLWDEGKNVATLDAAAEHLQAPFQAAGSTVGPNGSAIQLRHIDRLGVLGEAQLAGVYAARPVYASAALYEPFGLSVLEAAQAGCALVLSDIPTHREIWNGAAILLPPRDSSAFAGAISDLIGDPDERQQLGQLARARAQHYTPERTARGMASIYARFSADTCAPFDLLGAA
jgi:glycosyltransferase involved in cell wall biosynthesis